MNGLEHLQWGRQIPRGAPNSRKKQQLLLQPYIQMHGQIQCGFSSFKFASNSNGGAKSFLDPLSFKIAVCLLKISIRHFDGRGRFVDDKLKSQIAT